MEKKQIEQIRKEIKEIFGWTISEWAKRRGFSKWDVFNVLHGRSRGVRSKKAREILEVLEKDLGREERRYEAD